MKCFYSKSKEMGQSTVEYILLLAVVTVLTASILRSDALRNAFGEDSELMAILKARMEYSYRHGFEGDIDQSNYDDVSHESYRRDGGSRFFIPMGHQYPPDNTN